MSLKLNLGDIHLSFQVKGYHKPQNKSWDEEWCKISLSLRSRDWLNYKIVEDEILLCCEIDALTKQLETVRNYKQLEKRTLSLNQTLISPFTPRLITELLSWIGL